MAEVIAASDPRAIQRAVAALRAGGLVAFPTDTVYGLAASAWDPKAIDRIFAAKGRPEDRALPILLAEASDVGRVALEFPPQAERLAARWWPGALTLVVPRNRDLPANLGPEPTVGIRVPDHALARAILAAAGPLAVTSANPSGGASPRTAAEVIASLGESIDLVVDGGEAPGGEPSTVVDCTMPEVRLLRQGAIPWESIQQALSPRG
jgi:L-threonylcarbamoyladenylate synthase